MAEKLTVLALLGVLISSGTIGCTRRSADAGKTARPSQESLGNGGTGTPIKPTNPVVLPAASGADVRNQLIGAIDRHDTAAAKLLVDRLDRVDDPLPLCEAATQNETAVLKMLLDKGADVRAKPPSGETALICAARTGADTTDAMKLLIAKGASSEDQVQALFAVAESVVAGKEIMLLPAQAPTSAQQQRQAVEAADPWDVVNIKKMELILASGVGVNVRDRVGGDNATPLVRAAAFGNTAVVRLLLAKGAQVNARDKDGDTALIAAACSCAISDMPYTLDSMELLVNGGADVEAKDKDGRTALMAAAGWGRTEIVSLLLRAGADVEDADSQGNTALMIAAQEGGVPTTQTVQLLLEKRANIEAKNNEGNTALILAASTGGAEDAKIVTLLLARGADLKVRNNHGDTALSLATRNSRTEIVQLLKKALAKIK